MSDIPIGRSRRSIARRTWTGSSSDSGLNCSARRLPKLLLLVAAVITGAGSPAAADEPEPFNVFILAGLSNMAGADSVVPESPLFQQTLADRATLFTTAPLPGGAKSASFVAWETVRGHSVKNNLSHGPEVGFARTLHQAGWKNVAIVKVYANFGRNQKIWPWGAGGHLFEAWTEFVDDRLAELRKQGRPLAVRGFVWHQGIDDAIHGVFTNRYEQHLTRLIGLLRKRYNADHAPFVLARSVNSRIAQPTPDPEKKSPMAAVRRAQMQIAKSVPLVAWINVDDLPNVNTHHFTAEGQLIIGRRFGNAFLKLLKESKFNR